MHAIDSTFDLPDTTPGLGEQDNAAGELPLALTITDPEVIAELSGYASGAERARFARTALRIGVLCLRQARGEVDAGAVKRAGDELIGSLREVLAARAAAMTGELVAALAHYLDPDSGVVHQRMRALLDKNGELERVLAEQVGGDHSALARTLAAHVGEASPLFKLLSPTDGAGVRAQLEGAIEAMLGEHRAGLARELSLDDDGSALSRLVRTIETRQAKLGDDVKGQVEVLRGELTLDRPDSALSRMHDMLHATQGQIDRHLTLDSGDSALARLRGELLAGIAAIQKTGAAFQGEVREALAAMQARKAEAARGTAHGGEFEDQAGAVIADLAARKGDVYDASGATTGVIRNCKVGDHVVAMGADSRAPGARIVWEAKQKDKVKLSAALAEIARARANRAAQVGVFVYSARVAPAGVELLARHGDDIVVVWDADDPTTDAYLAAAYALARGMAMAEAADDESAAACLGEIDAAAREIERQLKYLGEMNTMAKTIGGHADKIMSRTDRMQADLARAIERIDEQVAALSRGGDDGDAGVA